MQKDETQELLLSKDASVWVDQVIQLEEGRGNTDNYHGDELFRLGSDHNQIPMKKNGSNFAPP